MSRKRADYLLALCRSKIRLEDILKDQPFKTGLKEYVTKNPVHARQVQRAVNRLKDHFDKLKPKHPLNSLILGPPGSGKTYLAEQFESDLRARLLKFNLSQCEGSKDIKACFQQILEALDSYKKVIGFFDEFDVRLGGVAAVQFLIQPMYDQKSLSRCAFIFSGSYLKDRQAFENLGPGTQALDFVGFLYDVYAHARCSGAVKKILREFLDVTMNYYPIRKEMLPATNVLEYLRSLDKITDFMSRINGFVVELPDLSTPLNATRDHFVIALRKPRSETFPDPTIAAQLIELVDGLRTTDEANELHATDEAGVSAVEEKFKDQRFYDYRDSATPLMEYKNLMLLDRYFRVLFMLSHAYGAPGQPVKVRRSLLNYLTVAPLIHGMRSLNTLIESLNRDLGTQAVKPFKDDDLAKRHIANYRQFPTPERTWSLVRDVNDCFFRAHAGFAEDLEVSIE